MSAEALARLEAAAEKRYGRGAEVEVTRDERACPDERVMVTVKNALGAAREIGRGADRTKACNAVLTLMGLAPAWMAE